MSGGSNWRFGEGVDPETCGPEELVAHLQRQTEELRSLVEATAGTVLRLDSEGTIKFVDETVTAALGFEPDDLVEEPLDSLVVAAETTGTVLEDTAVLAVVTSLAETTGRGTVEVPFATADGGVLWGCLSASALAAQDQYLCVVEFDGERDRADGLVDAVGDPLYVLDDEGTIERVNDAMTTYTGYERDELVGRAIGELIPAPEYSETIGRLSSLAAGDGDSATFETTLVTKDGELIHSEAKVTALTDDGDEYVGSVGVLRDIRGRKQRERDLELLKQVLTRVFRHNVRNELTVVQTNAELVERETEADTEEYTTAILDTCRRLLAHSEKARLMEQVVETDVRREVDIASVVGDLATSARQRAPDATIEVEVAAPTRVEAHPDISKAIEELIENAIQHAPDDEEPTVRIWTDETEAFRTLFVEDESSGLADHEIEVLRTGDESDLEHGSGVGLWLVRWLVEHSNAEIIAHRTEEGSLMGIRFPRLDHDVGDAAVGLDDESTPFTRAPPHVTELSPERFHGKTVVGRMEELHQLEDTYTSVERTGGHAVLVTGETGVGKTTLVDHFRGRLPENDDPPLQAVGHCKSGITPPYDAIRQALSDLPVETELEATLAGVAPTASDDPELVKQRKQALFADVAETLRNLAIDHPVVVVVEDLQWADTGTVDLLRYLIEEVGRWALPILFVGTYRTGAIDDQHPIVEITERTTETGRGTVLELEPFDPVDVRNLLEYMLDVDDVPESFVAAVHDQTGGTPLFVAEIGRQLAETLGSSPDREELPESLDSVALPESVENVVTDRIDALYGPVWEVLELGAVVGDTVPFGVLRDASDHTETELVEYVDRLVQKHVWKRTDGKLAFVHGVVREKTLERIDEERRQRLHARVARAVKRVYAGSLEAHYGRLAAHYDAAGNSATAIEYYRQAGERAADAYAHEDAITSYEQALSLAEDGGADRLTRARLHGDLAEVYRTVGDLDSARETGRQGLAVAADESRETCRLLGIVAEVQTAQGEFEQASTTTEHQHELAANLGAGTFEAEAVRRLGVIAKNQGAFDRAREHYEKALTLADEDGDREFEATVRKERGVIAWRQGEYDEAHECFAESLDIARDLGARSLEAACLNNLGGISSRQGEYEQAIEYNESSLDIKRDIGDRKGEAYSLNNLGEVFTRLGDYEQAIEYYGESLDIKRDIGDPQGQTETLLNLGIAARHQGKYEQARAYHEESLDTAREIGGRLREARNLVNIGGIAIQQNAHDEARECFAESLDMARELDNPVEEIDSLRGLGVVAREQGAHEQAADYFQQAMSVSDVTKHPTEIARTRLEAARLALARDDTEAASDHIEGACETFERLDTTLWIGRCRTLKGQIAAARASPTVATDHWESALETFETIGTPDDALAVLALLVAHCQDRGDVESARTWCRRARQSLDGAPEPVVTRHAGWIHRHETALGLDE